MNTQAEDDVLGAAFNDYLDGDRWGMFRVHSDLSGVNDLAVAYYFRQYHEMGRWDQMAIDLCRGKVLDVGAGAGCHSVILQQKGLDVTSLDISPGAVVAMKRRGLKPVCADFFQYGQTGYDHLLFLMNGIGLAGTLDRLENLLLHAKKLLSPGGNILMESSDLMYMYEEDDGSYMIPLHKGYYGEVTYMMEYRGMKGKPFPWLFADYDSLASIAHVCGLSTKMIFQGENNNFLVEMKIDR